MHSKLVLYISMSIDGFIATEDDDLSFLSLVEKEGEDYGYFDFIKTIDTVIIGRKTFDKVISMGYEYPHKDKDVYIITRIDRPEIKPFKYYSDDIQDLITTLKTRKGKNIYCDGGAEIVNELLKLNLFDEMIISVIPVLLGDGIRLFRGGRSQQKLELISTESFEKGLVQLHYKCHKA